MKLTTYSFFNELEKDSRIFLENHIKPITVPKGNLLFYQGDICENILWLTQGEVRLYRQEEGIEEITIYILKAGEQCIVNTASLLSQTEAVASAITLSDIKGYLIDAKSIKKLSRMSDVYYTYLFSLYHIRFEALTQLVGDIKFKRLDTRIMEWLKKQPEPICNITHENLALELGSTRVTISRILKDLEVQGKVILHRGKIELL